MSISVQTPVKVPLGRSRTEGDGNTLRIARIEQAETYWCWAACGEMIARYFKIENLKQCEIVNRLLRRRNVSINACLLPAAADVGCPPESWPTSIRSVASRAY